MFKKSENLKQLEENFEHTAIFETVMRQNNKRLIKEFVSIAVLANTAALMLLLTGGSTKHLSITSLVLEFTIIGILLLCAFLQSDRISSPCLLKEKF